MMKTNTPSSTTFWFFIFCVSLSIIFLYTKHPNSCHYFRRSEYHVQITNGFSNNSSLPLIIWCSSQYDELGSLALQEGDNFSWNLRSNILGIAKSQYICTMKWDLRKRKFVAFSGHRDARGFGEKMKCLWLVKEDGFYFSNDEISWKKKFSWP